MAAGTIGGSFALAAFAVAIVAGLASGNPAASVLLRALLAMLICYPVGMTVGLIAQRIVLLYSPSGAGKTGRIDTITR